MPETEEFDTFFITPEEEGERLDKILANRLNHMGSRTYFQFLLDENKVLLNGNPVKKRIKPKVGDEIEVEYVLTPELSLKPENIPLNILFEDEHLLVINKPAGMVVHPAVGNWTGTFVNALMYHCQDFLPATTENIRPGIVHRLDKETSGLLMAAKTAKAQQKLIEMFTNRQIHKEYLAICVGNPGTGTVEAPIGRHPIKRKMMAIVEEGGRSAITHYKTLFFDGKISFAQIILATGRTHQIRVHMKHHGTPILGDSTYGVSSFNERYRATRQMLHASLLSFTHPILNIPMEIRADLPEDMSYFMNLLKGKAKI